MLRFEDFPKHLQAMLLAARTRAGGAERMQLAALVGGELDWTALLEVAAHHRLNMLVFEGLEAVRSAGVPVGVRAELQARARSNAFEALRAAQEVRRITEVFAGAGFELKVMKGVALSQMLYGSANARHVGDLDLLTQPEGLAEQERLLTTVGYQRVNPAGRLTPLRRASYVSFWKDFTFRSQETGFELDLHWRLFNNRYHAANRLLEQAEYEVVTVFGVEMRVFAPAEQFLYLAAHGTLDAWTYLKSLADIAAFLRVFAQEQLDAVLERAEELGLRAQVSAAVHLANDWMGAGVTSALLLPEDEATAQRVREHTTAMLLKQDFRPVRDYPSPAEWLRLEMEMVPGVRSRVELARRFVWRPRVWAQVDLPDELFWMYPVLGLLLPPRWHSVEQGRAVDRGSGES